ncbi:MAG: alanine--tRNA ligase [bacterium]
MKQQELRQAFLGFFKKKNHDIVKASPLVLPEDPTLLFVNAGMNQFKDVFLSQGTRPYTRAVNSQMCVRVSGKHNDLEDVGKDSTHLTSFEMLGNWSFGDYYKKEAIVWAWEFLSTILHLPKAHLYASVHHNDTEALEIWKKHTDISPTNIVKCGDKDNFWEMGETGPCGPCSEIHFDMQQGPLENPNDKVEGVNGSSGRVVEIWNLVFIQSQRQSDGALIPLKNKHVDTGAGFERLLTVMQNKASVYDTDVLAPIITQISKNSGHAYHSDERGMPHRVIADHVRTLSMAIADNVMPSNEGRGYVLRRLLRRASRFARQLGQSKPFIYQLVPQVVASIGQHFEQLGQRQEFIQSVIESEESQFLKTLDKGLQHFETAVKHAQSNNAKQISGQEAFKLYDTYGFPLDLTQVLAQEQHLSVDQTGFEAALTQQKQRSRAAQGTSNQGQEGAKPKGGEARFVHSEEEILKMSRHHSATHLLQAALQQCLGDHVNQAGSLVDVDHLRFDFTHPKALTQQEFAQVQAQVDQWIGQKIPVTIDEKPYQEAKDMGAMALFGEKYGDVVRVVQMGKASMELCVGHHVANTQDIQCIKLLSETGIAAGVRRIEAIAGQENLDDYAEKQRQSILAELKQKQQQLQKQNPQYTTIIDEKASIEHLLDIKETLIHEQKEQEKQQRKTAQKNALAALSTLTKTFKTNDNIQVCQARLTELQVPQLKALADELAQQKPAAIVLLVGAKGSMFVKVAKSAVALGYDAGNILRQMTHISGGKGGGRAESAQGGGANLEKCEWALRSVQDSLLKTSPEQTNGQSLRD